MSAAGKAKLLLRTGNLLPVNGVVRTLSAISVFAPASYAAGQARSCNSAGTLAVSASFKDRTQGVFTVSAAGAIAPVLTNLSAAPGITGAKFSSFASPIENNLGHVAFRAAVTGPGVTAANSYGIWANKGSSRVLVARTGVTPAPGVARGGVFATLGDPLFNKADRVAFRGVLKTGVAGVSTANSAGIWANTNTTGALALVARAQAQAAMCPAGARFNAFRQLVLPETGGVVFLADLVTGSGGVTGANNLGLWAANSTGTLKLVARTGDRMIVDDAIKTLLSLSIFGSTPEAGAQTRSFSSSRHLVYKAMFNDGTQGLFEAVAP